VDRHEIVGLSLEGPDHCPCAARPGHRAPERRGYLIFGDGRQFPNLFFYNSAARSAGPFSATFETHKAAGAAGDDRGYVSYNGREPLGGPHELAAQQEDPCLFRSMVLPSLKTQ
jgi:hypothetical protein